MTHVLFEDHYKGPPYAQNVYYNAQIHTQSYCVCWKDDDERQ